MAFNAGKKNGPVLLSHVPESGVMVRPLKAATGYEVVQARHPPPVLVNGLSWIPIQSEETNQLT